MIKKAGNYRKVHLALMKEWEQEGRKWLEKQDIDTGDMTFFRDGVFDPEIWFAEDNEVRPLFVLKEVNDKNPSHVQTINFVGRNERFCDPWKGEATWRRLSTFAKGLFCVFEGEPVPDYTIFDKNSELEKHRDILKRIAIMNLKKFPGGSSATDDDSKNSITYDLHAKRFDKRIRHEMELINPSIIVCCGVVKQMKELFPEYTGIMIECAHPGFRGSVEPHYSRFIDKVEEFIKNSKVL